MRIAIIGSGGREHALAWKLAQSPLAEAVWAGTHVAEAEPGLLVLPDFTGPEGCADFCRDNGIDFVVVGPEAPLVDGWADVLRGRDVVVFGPDRRGAMLEGSKVVAKEFMRRHGIPTADFVVCTDSAGVEAALDNFSGLPVVKFDGLAAGKGVAVPDSREEVLAFARGGFEAGHERILLEKRLEGSEVSLLGITDGRDVLLLPPCQDHKRLSEGDLGPNTGGMGAFTPVPGCDAAWRERMKKQVFEPFLAGIQAEGMDYRGVIYAGLMLTETGEMVLEFNCRFGDPETQPLMCAIEDDLLPVLFSAARGRLSPRLLEPDALTTRAALCVVLAASGYPAQVRSGDWIEGLETAGGPSGVKIFHAGTRRDGERFFTRGGRVLGVTGMGETLQEAASAAFGAVEGLHFPGMQFRRDIGAGAGARSES